MAIIQLNEMEASLPRTVLSTLVIRERSRPKHQEPEHVVLFLWVLL
jgi:hypothetical protein